MTTPRDAARAARAASREVLVLDSDSEELQDVTDFHAITVHDGRVWVVGSTLDDTEFGGTQKLILAHAAEADDLSQGSAWHVTTVHSVSGLCLVDLFNPVPCGALGTDFTFKAVAGDDDGLYIFGTWFGLGSLSTEGQRNRTMWHLALP